MNEQDLLADQFEKRRAHLKRVAYRMLGSDGEAEDAVQEAWLRLSRSDAGEIRNLPGWLTTVVARICLDILRSRTARRETPAETPEDIPAGDDSDPEAEALLADSMGPALLLVLETLSPPERVAFVLHDMFGMSFDEIGPIVRRSEPATRQLASRARRRIRGSAEHRQPPGTQSEESKHAQRRIVDAFLEAARNARFEELLTLLHPECVLRSDEFAALLGSPERIEGGGSVAEFFNGAAAAAVRTTIGGTPGAAWAPNGKVRVAFRFSFRDDRIVEIELIADRKRLADLGVELLDD